MAPKSFMDSAKLAVTLAAFLPLGPSSKGMSGAKGKVLLGSLGRGVLQAKFCSELCFIIAE